MTDQVCPWKVVLKLNDHTFSEVTVFLMDGAKPLGSATHTFGNDVHPTKLADMVKVMVSDINTQLDFATRLQEQLGDQFQVILAREVQ